MSADPDKATGCPNEKDKSVTSEFRECGDNTSDKSDECKKKNKIPRSVRFPDEDQIVTQYFEPANPWHDVPSTTKSQLAAEYLESCRRHNTPCIDSVLQQIRDLPESSIGGAARAPRLTLGECSLTGAAPADALEALMRKVQFRRLELEHATMDDEGAEAMFDMIEYYESATVLCISGPRQFGIRGWQAASRMIKKSADLSELEVTDAPLEASHAPVLARSLRAHTCRLRALCLQRVALCGEPLLCLVIALKSNSSIRELRLGDNRLSVSDAAQLASLLKYNTRIQLLDLSNNQIQDAGAAHLADALAEQASQSPPSAAASPLSPHRCQVGGHEARGLAFLVLWNNQLTRNCAPYLSKALRSSNSLCVLNIGRNALGNEAVRALARGGALVSVGLQAARLAADAAPALAELIRADTKLQRLDLRENRLGSVGLQAILTAMKDNSTLTQIDLDEPPESSNLSAEDPEVSLIRRLTREIRAMCRRNEPPARHDEDEAHPVHRKISLTCHTTCLLRQGMGGGEEERRAVRLRSPAPSPAPSPAGSPVPAPHPHSRFMVTRVTPERDSSTDSSGSSSSSSTPTPTRLAYCPPSRFKVVQVMEPPQIQVHPASSQPRKSPSRFSVTRNYDSVYNPSPSPPPPSPAPTQPVIYTQLQNEVVTQLKNEASQCKYDVLSQVKSDVSQLKYEVKTKNESTQCQNEESINDIELDQLANEEIQVKNEALVQIKNEPTQIQNGPGTVIKNEVLLENKVAPDKSEIANKAESGITQKSTSETSTVVKNEPSVRKVVTTQVRTEAMKQAKNEALSQVKIEPNIQVKNEVTALVKNIEAPVRNTEAPIKIEPLIHVENEAVTELVNAEMVDKNKMTAKLKNETNPIKTEAVVQLQNVPVTQIRKDPPIQVQNEASALKNESVAEVKNVVTTQLKNEPATLVKIESTIQLKDDQKPIVSANVESTSQTQGKCTAEVKCTSIEPILIKDETKSHIDIKTESATKLKNNRVESKTQLKVEPVSQIRSVPTESSLKTELPNKIVPIESSSTQNKPVIIEPKTQTKAITDSSSKPKMPAAQSILPKSSIPTIEESLTESEDADLCDTTKSEISKGNIVTKECENKESKSDSSKSIFDVQSIPEANKSNAIVEYAVWDLRTKIEPKIICDKPNIEPTTDLTNILTKEDLSDSTKHKTSIELSTPAEMIPLKTELRSDTQIKPDKTTQELTDMKQNKKTAETKSETEIANVISDLNVIDISIKNPTLVKSNLKYSDVVKSDKKVNSCDTKAKVVCDQNKDKAMQNIAAITEDLGNIIKEMQVLVKNRDSIDEIVPADSLVLKKNKSESSLDSPDLEVSRLMEKMREERSVFDSNSSLEISGSSMESLNEQNKTVQELDRRKSGTILSNESSVESASDATPVNSGNFLNLSLSSNESVSPIFGKTKLIHDSLSSLEASVSSLDSGRQEKIMVTSADSGIEYSLQHPSENREDNSSNEGTLTNNSSLKETVKKPEGFQLVESSPKRTSSLLDVPALKSKGLDRMRKISWVAPSSSFHIPRPDEKETKPSHLEKLLSIFQHPSSIFSRSLTSDDEKKSASNTPPRKDSSLTSSFWSWGSTIEKNEREEDSSEATDSTLSERVQVSFVDESFSRKLDSKTPSTDTDNTLSEFQSFPTQESECAEERVTITTEDIIVQNLALSVSSNTSKQRSEVEAKRSGDVDLLRDKDSGQEKEEKELARPRSFAAVLKSSGSENSLDKQNSPDNGQSVDKLPSKVIRGIKENISPENTLTSSMTNTKALAVELERQVKNPTVNVWEVTLKSEPKIEEVKVQSDLAPIATIEEANDDDPLQLAFIDDVKIDKDLSVDSEVIETDKRSKTTDGIDLGKDALSYLIYENRDFETGAENIVKTSAQQGSLAQELKEAEIKEILDLSPELVVEEALQDNVFTPKEIIGLRTSPIIPERAKLKKANSLEDLSQLQTEEKSSPKTKTIAFKVPESTTPRDIPERRAKLRTRSGSSPKSLPESLNKPCPLTKMESILNKKKKKVSSLGKMARDSLLALNMSDEEIAEFRRSYKLTSVESLKSLESVSEDANSQSGNSVDSRCRACLRTSQESLMSLDSISEDCRCTEDCERPGKSTR